MPDPLNVRAGAGNQGRGGASRDVRVYPDLDALSEGVAEAALALAEAAVAERGRFDFVLSGGHTPERLYGLLAGKYRERMPWPAVHIFWGDERYVPADDPLSNYRMTREAMLDRLGLPPGHVHPIPTSFAEPDEAARAYEKELRAHFAGGAPAFDLVLLGLGPEGHVASLFPGSPALAERERWVVPVRVEAKPPQRLTLTLPVLNRARNVFFLVAGEDKRAIVRKLFSSRRARSPLPAALIAPAGHAVWFLNQAAHG
jgi:6-phosphogluconolactonase